MTLRTLLIKLGFKGDIKAIDNFDKKISGLKTNVLGLSAIFAAATASLAYFLNEAAKLEQTKIAFEVMTNSVELGHKLIKDLFTFARTTPFRIPGVMQASKILLAMGIAADEQIDTLTKIGHVAAGIGKPLDQLASIFGRVKAAGYLTGYEMERLRRAGVPLGAYLSELLKKPEKDILHLIRSKQISFEVFADAWELMVEKRFPKLMDRLLLTFKGIVSNIQDYIYEIVAFSGEELLPVFKLMANQLMFLLDSSRQLIGLKFKQFFIGVSSALELMNKGFVKLYFRTRETITQFGGINKLFKIFITLLGTFTGVKTLSLIGKLSKIFLRMLTIGSVKMSLLGAGILLLFLAVEDFLGYLIGKKSVIGYFLDLAENRFPRAFKKMQKWLDVIKSGIEGLSFLTLGLFQAFFTGEVGLLEKGLKKFSEAYKKATEEAAPTEPQIIQPHGISMYRKPEDYILRPENFPEPLYGPRQQSFFEKFIAPLGAMSPGVSPVFPEENQPVYHPFKGFLEGIKEDISIIASVARQRKEYKQSVAQSEGEKILEKGNLSRRGLNINIPTNVTFNNLPNNINNEQIVGEVKNTMKDVAKEVVGEILKTELSAVEPTQE